MKPDREFNLVMRMMVGDFNENHDPDTGRFAEGGSGGEYQYHATRPTYVFSIYEQGLKPNKGMFGKGVYFAPSEEGALDWTESTTGGKFLMRVKTDTLKSKYDWSDMDDTQSMATKKISSKDIEVKLNGEWVPIKEFVERRKTSYRMWKSQQ